MAIFLKVNKCLKGHPLWITNGMDYFCKVCGDIDIFKLRLTIYNKIKSLRPGWLTRK